MLQRAGQLLPPLPGHAGGPGDEPVDGEWHRQARQRVRHLDRSHLPQRPASHHVVELHAPRLQLGAAPQPEPAVQDDQDDERDEQHALRQGDDQQELAAGHLPTQRLIFSSATRKLIGFTM